jgi:hypothetical protein
MKAIALGGLGCKWFIRVFIALYSIDETLIYTYPIYYIYIGVCACGSVIKTLLYRCFSRMRLPGLAHTMR